MAIAKSAAFEAEVGGETRRLILTNAEIERFEVQYDIGIFHVWDQLNGRGSQPQARHVRDLIALALVGGGMTDRAADALVGDLPPSDNLELLKTAQLALAVTFIPALLTETDKKKEAGSRKTKPSAPKDTTYTK